MLKFPSGLTFPVSVSGDAPMIRCSPEAVRASSRFRLGDHGRRRGHPRRVLRHGRGGPRRNGRHEGENVFGYVDESPVVDLSGHICEVCGRPFTEHDPEQSSTGRWPPRPFPDEPSWEGMRCPPEHAPAPSATAERTPVQRLPVAEDRLRRARGSRPGHDGRVATPATRSPGSSTTRGWPRSRPRLRRSWRSRTGVGRGRKVLDEEAQPGAEYLTRWIGALGRSASGRESGHVGSF